MANDMRVSAFVTEDAIQEVKDLIELMKQLSALIVELNANAKKNEGFMAQAKSVEEVMAAQKALMEVNVQLKQTYELLTRSQEAFNKRQTKSDEDKEAAQKEREAIKARQDADRADKKARQEKADAQKAADREEKARDKERMQRMKDERELERLIDRERKQRIEDQKIADAKADRDAKNRRADEEAAYKRERQNKIDLKREQRQLQQDEERANRKAKSDSDAKQRAAEKEKKMMDDLNDSYKQLKIAQKEAADRAINLAINLGKNHPVAKEAADDARKLQEQLKELEGSVGIYGRNVGNYSGATRELHGSIQQLVRELPSLGNGFGTFAMAIGNNIAPAADAIVRFREEQAKLREEGKPTKSVFEGLGSALFNWQTLLLVGVTLLTVYSDEIATFVKAMFGASGALDKAEASQVAFNEALNSSDYKSGIENFKQLEKFVSLATQGWVQQDDVLKYYNDTFGKTLGYAKSFNEVQDTILKKKGAYMEMLLQQAIATAALAKETENLVKSAQLRAEGPMGGTGFFNKTLRWLAKGNMNITGAMTAFWATQVSAADENAKTFDKIWSDALDEASKKAKEIGAKIDPFAFDDPDKKKKGKKEKTPRDLTNEMLKAQQALTEAQLRELQIRAEQEAEVAKQIADDENRSLNDRAEAHDLYTQRRLEAMGYGLTAEFEANEDALEKIAQIERKNVKDRTMEEQLLLMQKELYLQKQVNLVGKYNLEQSKITGDNIAFQMALYEAYLKHREKLEKEALERFKMWQETRLAAWVKVMEAEDKAWKEAWKRRIGYMEIAASVIMDIEGAITAAADKRTKKELEKNKEDLDERLANIELLYHTEEERALATAQAKAEAAQKEKQLEEERAQRNRRAAIFEKALTVSMIIAKTYLAAMDFMVKGILPADKVAGFAFAIASGLASAIHAAAAPIPEYFEGTGDGAHPGGPARISEGNLAELISEPGKAPYINAMEAVRDLPKGTRVMSNKDLLRAGTLLSLGLMPKASEGGSEADSGWKEIVGAIEAKPVPNFQVTAQGIGFFVDAGNQQLQYALNLRH